MTPLIRSAIIGVFAGTLWAGTVLAIATAIKAIAECHNPLPRASLTR